MLFLFPIWFRLIHHEYFDDGDIHDGDNYDGDIYDGDIYESFMMISFISYWFGLS